MIYLIFDCISANREVTFNEEFQEIAWVNPESLKELDLNAATRITFAKRAFFNHPLPRRFTCPCSENLNKCADAAVAAGQRNPPYRLPRSQPLHCPHDASQLPPVNKVHSGLGAKPTVERTHAHPSMNSMALDRLVIIDTLQQMADHVLQTRIRRHGQRKASLGRQGKLIQQQSKLSRIVLALCIA